MSNFAALALLALLAIASVAAALLSTTAAAVPVELLSTEQLYAAFEADGWQIADQVFSEGGYRGFYAQHRTATILSSGQPKKAYYFEGGAWDLGWLHGALSGRNGDAKAMCTTYIKHIVLNLLDESWDQQMAAKCENWEPGQVGSTSGVDSDAAADSMDCDTYEALLQLLDSWLITGAVRSFQNEQQKFPTALVTEMEAFVAGALAEDASCGCSLDKIVYLNYGIDFLMSALYSGQLPKIISHQAHQLSLRQQQQLRQMPQSVFKSPFFCNSFGASGAATASGSDVFMSRDFQLPTGLVYQDVAADAVFVPTDGRSAHVSSGAPAFIGRVSVLNVAGVAAGVDMLRAAPNAPDAPGINSILLLRALADAAVNASDAVERVAAAQRGTTWLYPLCDSTGDCRVLEAGKYLPPGEPFDPLQFVDSAQLRAALPSDAFFKAHSSAAIFDRGLYARPADWRFPIEFLDFNEALFSLAGLPYNGSEEVWGETGFLFQDFEEENEVTKKSLHNNYYPPQRESYKDLMLISNIAIVPEFRTAMMSRAGNFWEVTAHAAQWRYDTINAQLAAAYGGIDLATALRITSFLSPALTPDYWTNTLNDSEPMSAVVEGTMNVMHVNRRLLLTKTGYWADDWTQLTLTNFLPATADASHAAARD